MLITRSLQDLILFSIFLKDTFCLSKTHAKWSLIYDNTPFAIRKSLQVFGDSIFEKKSDKAVKRSKSNASLVKGATKSCFRYYSCVVIIFFNTGLWRSAFSTIFLENAFFVLLYCLCFLLNQMFTLKYVLWLLKNVLAAMWFCSHFIKTHLMNSKVFIKSQLWKTCFQRVLMCQRIYL